MPVLQFTAIIFTISILAGLLGSLTGLGGGVVLVPVLALLFKIDIHYAIGASLVSVIATSSGAAVAYVREGLSNIRIGMFLEVATTIGAILGAWLSTHISTQAISIVFGLVLLYSAAAAFMRHNPRPSMPDPESLGARLRLTGSIRNQEGQVTQYAAKRVPLGFGILFGAGTLSGLLGIGSGAVKVLGMDEAMALPFKVSTTTSNFMIGVTAAASAGFYLRHGYINATLSMPVMLGVLGGSLMGTRILNKTRPETLKRIFAVVILALAAEMIYRGIRGGI
jgi:uncharacterized protein